MASRRPVHLRSGHCDYRARAGHYKGRLSSTLNRDPELTSEARTPARGRQDGEDEGRVKMADLTGTLLPFQSRIVSTFDALPSATHSGLLILARGLGLRSIITSSLRRYDSPKHLVLVVNATPEDERGMGEDLGMRLRCVGHEMAAKERCALRLRSTAQRAHGRRKPGKRRTRKGGVCP